MGKVAEREILLAIVHFGDIALSESAIESIRSSSLVPDIAVVSESKEADYFLKKGIIGIKDDENRGYASRLNKAIDFALKSGYRFIILSNNDVLVREDTIEKMYRFISQHPESILAPVILKEDGLIESAGIRINLITGRCLNLFHRKRLSDIREAIILPDAVAGTFFMASSNIFRELRFDEGYDFYFEDVSFCLDASEKGVVPLVLSEAVIIHRGSRSMKRFGLDRIANMVTRNHIRAVYKHSILNSKGLRLIPCLLIAGYNLLYFGLRLKSPFVAIRGVTGGLLRAAKEMGS